RLDPVHAVPFTDEAIGALAGLDQGALAEAAHVPRQAPIALFEIGLATGFHTKADDIVCGHDRLPRSVRRAAPVYHQSGRTASATGASISPTLTDGPGGFSFRPFQVECDMSDGWKESAEAWIASMGESGDFGRQFILDAPMLARVRKGGFDRALDVGCGEGRFCRLLRGEGIETIGIDPTEALLEQARRRDPSGDYRLGRAEKLDFADGSFDLVVSYLTLIDIEDIDAAIFEMARVL